MKYNVDRDEEKWVIIEETRYLMKVNVNDYGQQAVKMGTKGGSGTPAIGVYNYDRLLLSNTDRHLITLAFYMHRKNMPLYRWRLFLIQEKGKQERLGECNSVGKI